MTAVEQKNTSALLILEKTLAQEQWCVKHGEIKK